MDRQTLDRQSRGHQILEPVSTFSAAELNLSGIAVARSATASVSAGIAAANVHLPRPPEPGPRFPGEDGGRSLTQMAGEDLDAALQLLAERAQYITSASGAAIALRRGEHNDMLCRASAGSNAPELGALLSMEYGLSGESIRTRRILRCDDADHDPRVNHEVCRQLGISSVVVMPIISENQVFGVFELLSGKPRAFDERDLSALRRLSEMVEIAVKHAIAQTSAPIPEPVAPGPLPEEMSQEIVGNETTSPSPEPLFAQPEVQLPAAANPGELKAQVSTLPHQSATAPNQATFEPSPKKALFWSAAAGTQSVIGAPETISSVSVPPGLRNLQKCRACGFPVSQGRTFCVECEEKQWRGQSPMPQTPATEQAAREAQSRVTRPPMEDTILTIATNSASPVSQQPANDLVISTSPGSSIAGDSSEERMTDQVPPQIVVSSPGIASSDVHPIPAGMAEVSTPESAPFLSSLEAKSWFAANKYVLGTLVVVAIVIGTIALLR